MSRTLWMLAVATLAVQVALWAFGDAIAHTQLVASWPPLLPYTIINLAVTALLVLTAGTGIYVAVRARRGGWVAAFGVALVLDLYGPFLAAFTVPYLLSVARGNGMFLTVLDIVLDALVPLLALAYTLRYRQSRAATAGTA